MKSRRRNPSEDDTAISRGKTANETSESIPTDVIIDILSRLPAKSIARCRCVSKTWASVLRLPCFTELFLTRSCARPQLLFAFVKDGNVFFLSAPQVQNPNENSSLVTATYHMKFPYVGYPEVSCSIRGLVCVTQITDSLRREIVAMICNPSTGQSFALPKMNSKKYEMYTYFWFDQIAKQCKVLYQTQPSDEIRRSSKEHVLISGNEKLSWRIVEIPRIHYPVSNTVCINGVLYYVALVKHFFTSTVIARFDVISGKFGFVKGSADMPSIGASILASSILVNYNGKLAALLPDVSDKYSLQFRGITRETRSFEMFILDDPAKHEWSKHVYDFPTNWHNIAPDDKLYFVGVVGTNEFLLSPRSVSDPFYLVYYNVDSKTVRRVEIQGLDAFKNCSLHISIDHVENVNPME